jgi:hypothetical protein
MRPFEPKTRQAIITSTLLWMVFLGIAAFTLSLITTAGQLSHATGTVTGPAGLFVLSKQALDGGGFAVSMRLGSGIPYYLVALAVASVAVTAWRFRSSHA